MDIAAVLLSIPFLAGVDATTAQRLAGLTNRNYLVVAGDDRYVVRVPGEGTSEYIDRSIEAVAARSAADAGVNVDVVHFDPATGVMVTRYVDGATTMTADLFTDLAAVSRAADAFRRLHTTARPFASDFALFAMIDEYKTLLAEKGAVLPDGYAEVQASAEEATSALRAHAVPAVPSHCDPLCENFLDTGESMYLIDYEYSGNNDPMWDLADLSVEGGFGTEQEEVLLRAYFSGEAPDLDAARFVVYKAMCDLLWTLWGVIQHANNNPADDFWAYAVGRFDRCRQLMNTQEFERSVERLRHTG